jgi:hypothetical protein
MKSIYLVFLALFTMPVLVAQEAASVTQQEESPFGAGVDINSRYVWRGLLFNDAPNIQPYMSLTKGGFTLMAWGSYALSKNYAEIDLSLTYSVGNFSFTLNDAYNENEPDMTNEYTEWRNDRTPHFVDAYMTYQLPVQKLPLVLTGSILLVGDPNTNGNPNYTKYFEVAYPFTYKKHDFSIFAGGTPQRGYYSDEAAIVNLGFSSTYQLKINETFSIPVTTSLIANPGNKDAFFVVGFSL